MRNICIVPLIGIPGSGKTTLIKFIMQNKGKYFPYNIIHIDYDNIVKSVQSDKRFLNMSYNEIRSNIAKTVYCLGQLLQSKSIDIMNDMQEFILSIIVYDESGNNIIIAIDDTSYYRSMRYEYHKICKSLELSFYQIFLTADLDIALHRNSTRVGDTKIPPEIIKRMAFRIEIPNSKTHWEANTLVIPSNIAFDNETLLNITSTTNAMFLIPLKNVLKPITIVEQSLIHKIDLLLRKHIHKTIKEIPCKDKLDIKMLSNCLNEKRQQLLNDIKTGILNLKEESLQEFVVDNMKLPNVLMKSHSNNEVQMCSIVTI